MNRFVAVGRGFAVWVGVISLLVGVGHAQPLVIDSFSGVTAPSGSFANSPISVLPPGNYTALPGNPLNGPSYGANSTAWSITYAPTPALSSPAGVFATIVEPGPITGVANGATRTTTVAGYGTLMNTAGVAAGIRADIGQASYSAGAGITGGDGGLHTEGLTLTYNNFSAPLNLSGDTNLDLGIVLADHATSVNVTLEDTASNSVTKTYAIGVTPAPAPTIPWSDFAGVDLGNIAELMLSFDGGTSNLQLVLDSISTTPTPEPSTVTLLVTGGLCALAFAWRQRRRAR